MEGLTVTAVITTCRRPWSMIARAVESVLGQTRPVLELLLVDDNEEDSEYSRSIRKEVSAQPRIRYLPMGKNSGVAAARNRAIAEARGELLSFLDDDDEWSPDKIEVLTGLFEKHPEIGLAFGMGRILEASGEEKMTWQWEIYKEQPAFSDMLWSDYVGSASIPLIRVKALREVGGFLPRQEQPAEEDYELWIRIAAKYPLWGTRTIVFHKHMDGNEHISTNLKRCYIGFKNIYRINRAEYGKHPKARVGILWNVVRCGVRARQISVVPYIFSWAYRKIRLAIGG